MRRCVATCAAVAWLLVSTAAGPTAHAQPRPAVTAELADSGQNFALAPAPLDDALNRFARAAGINLSFDAALVGGMQGPALNGRYTVEQALAALLAGTGLEAVAQPGGGFVLRMKAGAGAAATFAAEQVLPPVTVAGRFDAIHGVDTLPAPLASGQVAGGVRLGLLGNTGIMDAPFSVTGYTSQAIQDQQARTVGEILSNDASVRFVSEPGGILDAFAIRGFPVGNGNYGEIALDGVYGVASNYRVSTAYVERVELIKGPTALLTGMAPSGSIGGGINIVPKRAAAEDFTDVTVDYASSAQFGGLIDLSRRVGEERRFGIRFNGNVRGGATALDNQSREAGAAALALDYRGTRLRATLDVIDQRERIDAPSRLPHIVAGIAVPDAPDGRRNISQPWEFSRIRDQSLLLRAEYDITDDLAWFVDAGGGRTRVARLFAITPTIVDTAGNVTVSDSNYRFNVDRASADTGLRARLRTGPVDHALVLSLSGYRDELGRGVVNSAVSSLTNLYDPVALPEQAVPAPGSVPTASRSRLTSTALADTLAILDRRVLLTLGVRHQRIRSDNYAAAGVSASHYDQDALTPMFGLVIKPWQGVSLYANRVEGLSKGDVAPNTAANAGEVFAPYRSLQYEVGAKVEQGGAIATLSVFQIARPGGRMDGNVYLADGEQRNRGLELNLFGEVSRGVRLLGSATLLDSALTRASDAALVGKTPIGVPTLQANLGAEWDLPAVAGPASGITLTGALVHTGGQFVDQANTQRIPAWTRLDLGARYRTTLFGTPTVFRLNVRNVFDHRYWSAVDAYGGLAKAEPRTVMLSATMRF